MTEITLAERAQEDLRGIFLNGLLNFGLRQAQRYADEVDDVFHLIASQPRMGRLAKSIGTGIRRHEHRAHVILYEEAADGITILAIVHASAMDRLHL